MERLTSEWQPDSNAMAESWLSHRQDENLTDGSTLTNERTDLRTPTKTRDIRLVPNAPTPVDKREFVRGDAVEVRMPHSWPRTGRVTSVLPHWGYVQPWSRSLGRFAYSWVAYHRDFLHHIPEDAVA